MKISIEKSRERKFNVEMMEINMELSKINVIARSYIITLHSRERER